MSDIRDPYQDSYPPSVWTVYSTGATAGIPGAWTPAGSTPPASVAALGAGTPKTVVASPTTAWTSGQYVQTATTGAGGRATWTGTGWVGGAAPLGFDPGEHTIAEIQAMVDEHPDKAGEVLAAEQARDEHARSTLVTWLQHRIDGTTDDDAQDEE